MCRITAGRRQLLHGAPALVCTAFLTTGCDNPQSALRGAGREAIEVASLWWIMLAGAAVIWLLVIGTAVYATYVKSTPHSQRTARWFLLGGGVALPVAVLAALLVYGLDLMSGLRPPGADLRIAVTGEQWWWRVTYEQPDGKRVVSANEIRFPAGRRVELVMESTDVIHSLWIPSLGGKLDMIPGRTTRLVLEPEMTGDYRGVCAEFCGASHTLMAFTVKVMAPEDFEAWLAREAAPAQPPDAATAREGAELFVDVGCGACHTVRGTEAAGTIGPDLTHLANRGSLAAGALPMTEAALANWIVAPQVAKPGARMPGFDMLGGDRITALSAYLMSLE